MTDHIIIERRDGLNIIRLNRPEKKNALTQEMYAAMNAALEEGEASEDTRVHVMLGVEGIFTSGNDIADFMKMATGGNLSGGEVHRFLHNMAGLKKPFVTGADGIAVGIGTTIHFHADMTFATPRTKFHTPFTDLALVPEAGSSLLVPHLSGHQRAYAMLAAGLPFTAEEAREAGLIWKVVEEDTLEQETLAAAGALASKPPQAMAIAKDLLRRTEREAISSRIDEEVRLFGERLTSAEAMAAFQAFMMRKK
jgi:enoyl-CoA hydratase/carnithine racemase